ncbi:MAG: hexokinase, partial [Actinobacteria bacterium]|nr:hexokinase [Actinomycetota bacterium]
MKEKSHGFLSKYGMLFSEINIRKNIDLFISEMNKGLAGNTSSLKMLPTYIEFGRKSDRLKPVIVMDAGGTYLRSAVVNFNKNSVPVISKVTKSIMPGVRNPSTKEEFFNAIFNNVKKVLNESDRIGFVFSYPIEIMPDMDGRLIKFTKEVRAPEVEGEKIGANLLAVMRNNGFLSNRKIVLLNDTVALLLSGTLAFASRKYAGYIGFVLGTGMNACYVEKNSNIKTLSGKNCAPDGLQLINIEAGNFSKGPAGKIDELYNKRTLDPLAARLEKLFSGAYLGGLALELLKTAAGEGMFSDRICSLFDKLQKLESREIDSYLNYPPADSIFKDFLDAMTEEDKVLIYFLLDALIERAAVISAIVIASAILKSGSGCSPCEPVCVIAEGSSFYNMKNFKSRLDCYLNNALNIRGQHYF